MIFQHNYCTFRTYIQKKRVLFYVHVTVHHNKFLFNKITDALIYQIYFVKKLYMFRAVPLPIIRSFSLHIQHWYVMQV